MSEFATAQSRRGVGGRPPTLEEWRRHDIEAPPAPQGGTRLAERIEPPHTDAWRDQAACKGKPTTWWFPEPNNWFGPHAVIARRICSTCPVQQQCGEHALAGSEHGIWGHRSHRERKIEATAARAVEREQARKPVPPPKPPRPFTRSAKAVLAVVEDGQWHDTDEIFDRVVATLDKDRGRARQAAHLRRRGRIVDPADLGPAGTRAGQRLVLQEVLSDLVRRGCIERVRGTVRKVTP